MRHPFRTSYLGKAIFLSWLVTCLALFVISPARVSHLQQFIFTGWGNLSSSLTRIDPGTFVWGFISSFLGVFIFTLACTSLGIFFLGLAGNRDGDAFEDYTGFFTLVGTAFLAGQIISSAIFLTLAAVYKITPGIVILFMAAMLALGGRQLSNVILRGHKIWKTDGSGTPLTSLERILFWLSIVMLVLGLVNSSSRLSYDAVAIYFSDAKLTSLAERIQFFPNDSFIVSSFHVGIQQAAIITVFGDQASRMYSWIGGVTCLIFTLGLAQKFGISKHSKLILTVMLLTSTAFFDLLGDGKIDLIVAAPAIAVAYWVLNDPLPGNTGASILIGLFAGFAIISRPYYGFLLPVFIFLVYVPEIILRKKEGSQCLRPLFTRLFVAGTGILVLLVFHLFANWIILGDPIAPLTNASKLSVGAWQWSFDPKQIWVFRLMFPLVVTFVNSPQSLGNISPLFLGFLPALLFPDLRQHVHLSKKLRIFLFAALTTLGLWIVLFFTVEEIRYVLFLWPIILMPVANIIDGILTSGDRILRGATVVSIAGLLIFLAIRSANISVVTYSPVDRNGSPQCYDSPLCNFIRPVNHIAAPGARVLALNAYRYYLRPDLFACSSKADEYIRLRDAWEKGDEFFWMEVHRQGYEYLTYEENYAVRHLLINYVPNPSNVPHWMILEPIYGSFGDDQVAYRIDVTTPPMSFQKSCLQYNLGIWDVK